MAELGSATFLFKNEHSFVKDVFVTLWYLQLGVLPWVWDL